jgi:hypothetical protein
MPPPETCTTKSRQPLLVISAATIGGRVTLIDDTSRRPPSCGAKTRVVQPPVPQYRGLTT